jgi:thioredoxin 1
MAGNVVEVADKDFQSVVLESDLPVLVDFWAPWCGPCRMVSPVIEELAAQNAAAIKVCKMNVDESPETAGRFTITAIPSVLFFKKGEELTDHRLVGVRPKKVYQDVITQVAAKTEA